MEVKENFFRFVRLFRVALQQIEIKFLPYNRQVTEQKQEASASAKEES